MLCSWLSHQHALDATPLAFYNVTLNKVLMHLDAMLLTFSCSFQHTLDASWCCAPDFLINTLLLLHPWLSPMSLWTKSWCLLMLCSWISHVTSKTLLMHLDATLLTFSSTRSWCYTLAFLQCHFEQGLDASWCYALEFLVWPPTHSWCILMLRSWLSHQHALDATPLAFYNVTLNKVLMHLDAMLLDFSCSFQHTLDASWCYAPDFLINTLLMLRPGLSTMSLWTWSWCILMLCSWLSHVASNTLLMHLDATLLTFSSTRSWCYALGFLQCHSEQGLGWSWCILMLCS